MKTIFWQKIPGLKKLLSGNLIKEDDTLLYPLFQQKCLKLRITFEEYIKTIDDEKIRSRAQVKIIKSD